MSYTRRIDTSVTDVKKRKLWSKDGVYGIVAPAVFRFAQVASNVLTPYGEIYSLTNDLKSPQ
jgi:hypothetical protein